MRYLTATLAVVMTSLWLGGLITLAVLVMAVFMASGLDRETAGRATSAMFIWFGRGQLIVGALALIAVFLGYLQNRGAIAMLLFAMLGLGAIGAVVFSAYFVPRIEALRIAGQAESVDFQTLHKQSEQLVKGLTGAVFVAALLLPAFCRALLAPKPKADSLPA
jgi:hypothetical protein